MKNLLDNINATASALKDKNKVLFVLTSNRGKSTVDPNAKSKALAEKLAKILGNVTIIDSTNLNIYPCEGNVSARSGNVCGLPGAALQDKEKNPSGLHRCWTSLHHADDELWRISKELLQSDAVIFFGSIRWGQLNAIYQKIIERLTWLENRRSTLGEENILSKITAGIIVTGHNWRVDEAVAVEKQVFDFFGFNTIPELCWGWQFTKDAFDESQETYKKASEEFYKTINNI